MSTSILINQKVFFKGFLGDSLKELLSVSPRKRKIKHSSQFSSYWAQNFFGNFTNTFKGLTVSIFLISPLIFSKNQFLQHSRCRKSMYSLKGSQILLLKNVYFHKNTRAIQKSLDHDLYISTQYYAYEKCSLRSAELIGSNQRVTWLVFRNFLHEKDNFGWFLQSKTLLLVRKFYWFLNIWVKIFDLIPNKT